MVVVLGLAAAIAALSFLVQHRAAPELSDEGFVWYGAMWTARGDVPLRDFRSYDPGWYYWSAAWFHLLGSEGPIALRLAGAVALCAGLAAAMAALARAGAGAALLAAVGALHAVWIFSLGEVLNATVALLALATATALLERPTLRRHVLAGVFVGLAGVFGRNHGLYAGVSFFLLILLAPSPSSGPGRASRVAAWAAGIAAGASPLLVMALALPGFAGALADSVLFWFRVGHTNLPRPVPWPWRVELTSPSAVALGAWFLLVPVFFAGLALLLLRRPSWRSPPLMAALAVGACYLHYTFSRPDIYHLGRAAVHPLLFGTAALVVAAGAGRRVWGVLALAAVAGLSLPAVAPRHPLLMRLAAPGRFQRLTIGGDALWVVRADAVLIRAARRLRLEARGDLYVASTMPGLYPVLDQRAPVWDTYPLLPETERGQEEVIARLARLRVDAALVCPWEDAPDPGGWGFANTHRLVWSHLREHWKVAPEALPYDCRALTRAQASGGGAQRPEISASAASARPRPPG